MMFNPEEARQMKNNDCCAICGKEFGRMEKLMDGNYIHILYDAAPCQKCHMTICRLLDYRKHWVSTGEYRAAVSQSYKSSYQHAMPLTDAVALLRLRDDVAGRALGNLEIGVGSVFVVQESFKMPPSPAIFILRARKLRNKIVLKGFVLKGDMNRDKSIKFRCGDEIRTAKVLDVVPKGKDSFERETFFSELSTNLHSHALSESEEGWIILDMEDDPGFEKGSFAAGI